MRLWRIATGIHPIWSGEGARLFGQRWNLAGLAAITTGTSFAVCLLEVLLHANRLSPPSVARYVEADVLDDVLRENFDAALHAGWDDPFDTASAQAFGRAGIEEGRSALPMVRRLLRMGWTRTLL